ncbi:hypothetical protein 7AX4_11 [uncultured Caudovirales phage]|uniref:Uncharacterized protein n=1 Tax=uncultured Caudovirales phage TaxID=2100421 RepID=A0A2H4JBF8_9CAUD|nr:hypothetical protein 7AX4_11 [uncultured Caudovirales phage]
MHLVLKEAHRKVGFFNALRNVGVSNIRAPMAVLLISSGF